MHSMVRGKSHQLAGCWALGCCLSFALVAAGAEPRLRDRIDREIARWQIGPVEATITDAQFLRRVSIDLLGRIPTPEETREFLASTDATKREQWVDRCLSSPEFVWRMTELFDVMWMERRPEQGIKTGPWREFLSGAIRGNVPLNEIARQILSADGADDRQRGAARFYLARGGESHLLTRDIGRFFFGRDLQCAQCHDHPLVGDYFQADYYGIHAFLVRSFPFTDAKKKLFFAERAEGQASFQSVFTGERRFMAPRLPGGTFVFDPDLPTDQRYKVAPAKNVRPIPTYSRRAELARRATDGTNPAFNRNLANRLWWIAMGRGLADPLDMLSLEQPPTHSELLDLLADELVKQKFNLRSFLKEIVLSQTYSRPIAEPADESLRSRWVSAAQTGIESWRSELAKAAAALASLQDQYDDVADQWDQAAAKWTDATDAVAAASKALANAEKAAAKPVAAAEAAQKAQTETQTKYDRLLAAAQAASAAVKLEPSDSELAQAATLFRTRADAAKQALAQASRTAAKLASAAESARRAVAEAKGKIDQSRKAQQTTAAQLAEVDRRRAELSESLWQAAGLVAAWKSKVSAAEHWIDYGRLLSEQQQSRQRLAQFGQQRQSAESARAAAAAKQSELMSRLDELRSKLTATERRAAELASQRKPIAAKLEVFRRAADAATAAAKLDSKDAQLAQAAATIAQRVATVQSQAARTAAETDAANNEVTQIRQSLAGIEKQLTGVQSQLKKSTEIIARIDRELAQLRKSAPALQSRIDEAAKLVTADLEQCYAIARLRPLSPEQLAWSTMTATGVLQRQKAAVASKLEKESPLPADAQKDAAKLAERHRAIEQTARTQLQSHVRAFVSVFGAGPGQPQEEFFATADQALFMTNGPLVQGWIGAAANRLAKEWADQPPEFQADQAYWLVLSRPPNDTERREVVQMLNSRSKDRAAAIADLLSALLASAEFRFNH